MKTKDHQLPNEIRETIEALWQLTQDEQLTVYDYEWRFYINQQTQESVTISSKVSEWLAKNRLQVIFHHNKNKDEDPYFEIYHESFGNDQ